MKKLPLSLAVLALVAVFAIGFSLGKIKEGNDIAKKQYREKHAREVMYEMTKTLPETDGGYFDKRTADSLFRVTKRPIYCADNLCRFYSRELNDEEMAKWNKTQRPVYEANFRAAMPELSDTTISRLLEIRFLETKRDGLAEIKHNGKLVRAVDTW